MKKAQKKAVGKLEKSMTNLKQKAVGKLEKGSMDLLEKAMKNLEKAHLKGFSMSRLRRDRGSMAPAFFAAYTALFGPSRFKMSRLFGAHFAMSLISSVGLICLLLKSISSLSAVDPREIERVNHFATKINQGECFSAALLQGAIDENEEIAVFLGSNHNCLWGPWISCCEEFLLDWSVLHPHKKDTLQRYLSNFGGRKKHDLQHHLINEERKDATIWVQRACLADDPFHCATGHGTHIPQDLLALGLKLYENRELNALDFERAKELKDVLTTPSPTESYVATVEKIWQYLDIVSKENPLAPGWSAVCEMTKKALDQPKGDNTEQNLLALGLRLNQNRTLEGPYFSRALYFKETLSTSATRDTYHNILTNLWTYIDMWDHNTRESGSRPTSASEDTQHRRASFGSRSSRPRASGPSSSRHSASRANTTPQQPESTYSGVGSTHNSRRNTDSERGSAYSETGSTYSGAGVGRREAAGGSTSYSHTHTHPSPSGSHTSSRARTRHTRSEAGDGTETENASERGSTHNSRRNTDSERGSAYSETGSTYSGAGVGRREAAGGHTS